MPEKDEDWLDVTPDEPEEPKEPFGAPVVRQIASDRLQRAVKIYDQAITSVWLGNGGAALALLAFIGTTWKAGGTFYRPAVCTFFFFVLGLITMGVGTAWVIYSASKEIIRLQAARGLMCQSARNLDPRSASKIDPHDCVMSLRPEAMRGALA